MNRTTKYSWRLFWFLLVASLLGVAAVIPYSLELSADVLRKVPLPIPLPVLLALQVVQNAIVLALAIGVGLLASRNLRLGAPVLEAWLYGRGGPVPTRVFAGSAIAGGAVGALTVVIAELLFVPLVSQVPSHPDAALALWKRFLACFYGAIDEEILMRLFLLSGLLWLIRKTWHKSQEEPRCGAFWATNLLVALLFGLGHMPAASLSMPMNAASILYILSLNGIASLLFGYLFWRYGLESAMLAHFFADIVLQVIAPALQR